MPTPTVIANTQAELENERVIIYPVDLAADVTGLLPSANLADSGAVAGNYGDSTHTLQVTVNAKGQITSISAVTAGASILPIQPTGRITLTSGTPSMVSSVTGATTVYYTPATGGIVPIYNGSTWTDTAFSELSQATTDATKSPAACVANSNYDIFVWSDGGTIRATRGPAWTQAQTFTVTIASPAVFTATAHGFYEGMPLVFSTTGALPTGLTAGTTYYVISAGLTANAFEVSTSIGGSAVNTSGSQSGTHTVTQSNTVRGTGAGTTELQFVNGLLVNKNSITNGPAAQRGTYVGSIRTNNSSQVDMIFGGAGGAGGEGTVVGIWNMYNRSWVSLVNFDTTDNWTYSTGAWRLKDAGNSTSLNRIMFLVGWQGDGCSARNYTWSANTAVNTPVYSGIGFNSTTSRATGSGTGRMLYPSNAAFSATSGYSVMAPLGFNYLAPLEYGASAGTVTWHGDNGADIINSSFFMDTRF